MSLRVVALADASDELGPGVLGSKAAGLVAMTRMGLPVPPGFVVTTQVGRAFLRDRRLPPDVRVEVREAVGRLERETGRRLGDGSDPLLLSVRSGAAVSMPGMMTTVLDVGASPVPRAAGVQPPLPPVVRDTRRRFVRGFATAVLGVDGDHFAGLDELWRTASAARAYDRLDALLGGYEAVVRRAGGAIPADPHEQVEQAVIAVLGSWDTARARTYRALHAIADDLGTGVVVQAMVLGNLDERSATGVAFSRDPATGWPEPFGDVLFGSQGEDVVAGRQATTRLAELATRLPRTWADLVEHLGRLEHHLGDMCNVEFTVESGDLWLLQVRPGGRTDRAAIRIAVDLAEEGRISRSEAVRRIRPDQVGGDREPPGLARAEGPPLATGLGASPGVATGRIATTAEDAVRLAGDGDVILVRPVTSPDDIQGIAAAVGVLTARGGLASHAAVVARSMGKPAVVGVEAVEIDHAAGTVTIAGTRLKSGDVVSIDGTSGTVLAGESHISAIEPDEHVERLLGWADDVAGVDRPAGTPRERLAAAHDAVGRGVAG